MTQHRFFPVSVLLVLLAFTVSAAGSSDEGQSGYIVVGLSPVAQFDAHYAFSTVPTKVIFVDNSIGTTPMTYEWDFGDGTNSFERNPVHMYLQRGTYTVSLTVKNAYGTSSAIKRNYITIGVGPRAGFSASPETGKSPLTVKFADRSLGQVETWTWDFGDGTASAEQNPVHTYWAGGIYTVLLTVSNEFGSSDVMKTEYITVARELKSVFSAEPAAGRAPLDVKFTDRSPGAPATYAWDFGDNSTSTERNPSHRFTSVGSYDVRLTVNRGPDTDSSSRVVNVGGVPITDFAAEPRSANAGEQIRFTDNTKNAPAEWYWDFGDTAVSTERDPSHSYLVKGIYTIRLTTKNANGGDEKTIQDYINIGIGPRADFIPVMDPYQKTKVPREVRFLDQSANLPTSWQWDFGDGQSSDEQNPRHMYMSEGVYTVGLTVKNTFGQDTSVRSNLITVEKGPAVDFTADKTTVGVNRMVTFTDLSSNSPTSWVWDFGDGSTGTGERPDHMYRKTGVYDVSLTASSPDSSNSMKKNRYIAVLDLPGADFGADRTRGGAPLEVQFADRSSGSPVSWNWDFGDGATSTEQNPVHRYTTLGSFTVTLTAANSDGRDTTSRTGYIVTTLAPVAEFRADRQTGKAPFVVHFTDLSTGSPDTWSWEFGDGTGSSEQNPSHIYMNEGAYDVGLAVSNQYGSDSLFKNASTVPVITEPARTQIPLTAAVMDTALATTLPATAAPQATRSPLSPLAAVTAILGGLVLATKAAGRR